MAPRPTAESLLKRWALVLLKCDLAGFWVGGAHMVALDDARFEAVKPLLCWLPGVSLVLPTDSVNARASTTGPTCRGRAWGLVSLPCWGHRAPRFPGAMENRHRGMRGAASWSSINASPPWTQDRKAKRTPGQAIKCSGPSADTMNGSGCRFCLRQVDPRCAR